MTVSTQAQNISGFVATYQTKSIIHLQTEKWEHSTKNLCARLVDLLERSLRTQSTLTDRRMVLAAIALAAYIVKASIK